MCLLTNKHRIGINITISRKLNQEVKELEYIYPFFPPTTPVSFAPVLNKLLASGDILTSLDLSKQRLPFQNTPDNLHNFVSSLWAWLHYIQLYHSANASDVGWFWTHSDCTEGQRWGEG